MWWVGPVPTGWGLWSWPCLEAPPHLPMPTVYLASLAAQGLLFCSLEWGVKVQDCRKDPSPTGPQVGVQCNGLNRPPPPASRMGRATPSPEAIRGPSSCI